MANVIINPYSIIDEYLKTQYTPLNSWLYFNATPMNPMSVSMNSVPGDAYERKFISGAVERSVIFSIDMIQYYDQSGASTVNMDAMDEVLNLTQWLALQDKEKNYPVMGERIEVSKMEILTNVPSLLVDTVAGLAKYQFQGRIIYIDRREEI